MSRLWVRDDGFLVVKCDYEQRNVVKEIGGRWDGTQNAWTVAFTMSNVEFLLDNLDAPSVDDSVEKRLFGQKEKETRLEKLREMSKQDVQVRLMVPGLKETCVLYNYQKLGVVYALTNGEGVLIADVMGLGKANFVNTPVLTSYGWRPIGSLKIGDMVYSRDGTLSRVRGVYPQGVKELLRVTFSDGYSCECGWEHLWIVQTENHVRRKQGWKVLDTRRLYNDLFYNRKMKTTKWRIPLVEPIVYDTKSYVIPPYLMGVLIVDGSLTAGDIVFVPGDDEVPGLVEKCLSVDYKLHRRSDNGTSTAYCVVWCGSGIHNPLRTQIVQYGLNVTGEKKFIPREYFEGSVDQRKQLLAGLLDTDGSAMKARTRFSTGSVRLADDVVELVQSLGGMATKSVTPGRLRIRDGKQSQEQDCWQLVIRTDFNPFLRPSSMIKWKRSSKLVRSIVSIEPVRHGEAVCISVDSNDHSYVIQHHIVTHNTLQAIAISLIKKSKGEANNCLIITPASLKYNWPLEIEKFTNEKYVVIDGAPEERIAQWMRKDVFFHIVNYEIIIEDLFGGREFKINEDDDDAKVARKMAMMKKAGIRKQILAGVRQKIWDLIIVDECFPYNTIIDTSDGKMKIGDIVKNKRSVSVLSCNLLRRELSYNKVVRWIERPLIGKLVEITHEYGKFVCTANHRIWTEERGYIQAGELLGGSTTIHMLVLSRKIPSKNKETTFLQEGLCLKISLGAGKEERQNYGRTKVRMGKRKNKNNRCVQAVSRELSSLKKGQDDINILLDKLREQVENVATRDCQKSLWSQDHARNNQNLQGVFCSFHCEDSHTTRASILLKELCCDLEKQTRRGSAVKLGENVRSISLGYKGKAQSAIIITHDGKKQGLFFSPASVRGGGAMEKISSIVSCSGRQAIHNRTAEKAIYGSGGWMDNGIQGCQPRLCQYNQKSTSILPSGHSESRIKNICGGRRIFSSNSQMEDHRQSQREGLISSRMESVKILESGDYERLGFGSEENPRVYNLEVERNHNYLADGVLVSNCHACKSHKSRRSMAVKRLNGKFRIGLTGTPMDGRLEELHSVMEFVYPGLLESRTRFLQKHAETDFWGKITGYKDIASVRKRIAHCFLRRLKEDVLKDLPDKIYENRIVELSPEERKIYKELASRGHIATQDSEAMVAVIRCKQFCDHGRLINEPNVRSSKIEALRDVLDEVIVQNGHKVIVFSQYKQMLNILVELFDDMGLKYLRIDGDTPKKLRADMQKMFNDDKSMDIIVGTGAMSAGLNLTGADYVVLYDQWWSNILVDQAIDRSHRIGQKNTVTVITFTCRDTIEERIIEVLKGKAVVTAETLGDDCDSIVIKSLGPKQIAALL